MRNEANSMERGGETEKRNLRNEANPECPTGGELGSFFAGRVSTPTTRKSIRDKDLSHLQPA